MSLTIIIGPMYSGKTTELMRRLLQFYDTSIHEKRRVLVINSILDTRDEKISSHCSNFHLSEDFTYLKSSDLSSLNTSSFDIIGIDESQFFDGLTTFVYALVEAGKHVYCAGLSGSYQKREIGEVCRLIPLADEIVHLKSICYFCNQKASKTNSLKSSNASFTLRVTNEKNLISVDAKYYPVCGYHHKKMSSSFS